jgi:hypothetical protein
MDSGQLLARGIAGAQLVIFPGLGHLFFWEDPGALATTVTAFLLDGTGRANRVRRRAVTIRDPDEE